MDQQIPAQGHIQCPVIPLLQRRLHAAQAGGSAAAAGVLGGRIVVVQLAPGKGAGIIALKEMVEELFVLQRVHPQIAHRFLLQAPADVVVAAHVVDKGVFPGQGRQCIQLPAQQGGVPGGYGIPDADHAAHIVEHIAFRLIHRAKVGGHLARFHDHLALEDHRRADQLGQDAQHPHNGMHLGQVTAAGAQLFPDIGHGVDAEHVHPQIGQEQQVAGHLVKDHRVAVVHIPLVGIEGGQHILAHLLAPDEVARRGVGEHLGHGLLKLAGNVIVVIALVAGLVLRVAFTGTDGPVVLIGGMVDDKVQAQAHPPGAAGIRQLFQGFIAAQPRVHLTKVAHGVSPVVELFRHLEQRHQMQIAHLQFRQIVQLFPHAVQVARKQIGIEHHADHVRPAVPVGILFPGGVQLDQGAFAMDEKLPGGIQQLLKMLRLAVQFAVKPLELVVAGGQPPVKLAGTGCRSGFTHGYPPPGVPAAAAPVRRWHARCGATRPSLS